MVLTLIRVAIYLRVSSEGQVYDESGNRIEDGSLQVQKNRAIQHIKAQCANLGCSFEITHIIEDAGKSAKDTNREGYQRLLQLIDDKQIDWVVASELSRFNRDTLDYLLFKSLCSRNNVQIVYVGSTFRERDDVTDLMETVLAASAEFERKITAQRIKRSIKSRLISDGKINGTTEVLGLDRCKKRKGHFVINEEEVLRLKEILEIYLIKSSIKETLNEIQKRKIFDKNNKEMSEQRLRNILRNVEWRYSGRWFLKESNNSNSIQVVDLDHGKLIDENLKDEVLEKKKSYFQKKSKCGKRNHIYLLSNILRGPNFEKFSGQIGHGRSKDYRYYYSKELKFRLNAIETEELIVNRVVTYFKDSRIFKKMINDTILKKDDRVVDLKRALTVLRQNISKIEEQVRVLVSRLSNSHLSDLAIETIAKKISDLEESKKNELVILKSRENELAELRDLRIRIDIQEKVEKFASDFKKLERVQKKLLLEDIFERIEVLDEYSLKLHIKKAPTGGAFLNSLPNGCDSELNGGSTGT